jgi:hypothetical protein
LIAGAIVCGSSNAIEMPKRPKQAVMRRRKDVVQLLLTEETGDGFRTKQRRRCRWRRLQVACQHATPHAVGQCAQRLREKALAGRVATLHEGRQWLAHQRTQHVRQWQRGVDATHAVLQQP